jgi:hypothetical protein
MGCGEDCQAGDGEWKSSILDEGFLIRQILDASSSDTGFTSERSLTSARELFRGDLLLPCAEVHSAVCQLRGSLYRRLKSPPVWNCSSRTASTNINLDWMGGMNTTEDIAAFKGKSMTTLTRMFLC